LKTRITQQRACHVLFVRKTANEKTLKVDQHQISTVPRPVGAGRTCLTSGQKLVLILAGENPFAIPTEVGRTASRSAI